jgi:hypothetical protein
MEQFEADPGYQFRMSEGMKALERSAASRGILQSGQTLKNITRFGQDAASQEYQNAFQRYLRERQQKLQPLEYRIGLGQAAASGQAANVGSTAQNVGNLTTSLGNIQSAGIMGQANAFTNTLGNISGLATDAASAYGQYQGRAAVPELSPRDHTVYKRRAWRHDFRRTGRCSTARIRNASYLTGDLWLRTRTSSSPATGWRRRACRMSTP